MTGLMLFLFQHSCLQLPYLNIQTTTLNPFAAFDAHIINLIVISPEPGMSQRVENRFRQVIEVSLSSVWGIGNYFDFDAGLGIDTEVLLLNDVADLLSEATAILNCNNSNLTLR
ncbi:hypothetical protein Xets_01097 [Xenorhabdus sp. TS4]|nr:hypothetical protein [Xenorhabdus sp. TS4]